MRVIVDVAWNCWRLVGVGEEFVGVVWSLLAVTWNCWEMLEIAGK